MPGPPTARAWAHGLSLLFGFPHLVKTSEAGPTLDRRVQLFVLGSSSPRERVGGGVCNTSILD